MFEKFTERARKAMSLARQEAQRLESEVIETEHILLGIVREGGGVAAKVLKNLNVDLQRVRQEIETLVLGKSGAITVGKLPFSPRAKRSIELAGEAASELGHEVIGTEHLLLGLIRENEGIAARVLDDLGLKLDQVREMALTVMEALTREHAPQANSSPRPPFLEERNLSSLAVTFRPLEDRPRIQDAMVKLLQQGQSIALVGMENVGKTSLVLALSRAKAGTFSYWSIDYRMFDEFLGTELSTIKRPGTVCFVPQGELLTASRSLDVGHLQQRKQGGERLILEFREGGLETFAARFPNLSKDLVTVPLNAPDPAECRQLLESARSRLAEGTRLGISDAVLQEADRLAREQWPRSVAPWATLQALWKAAAIQKEIISRGDVPRLEKDIELLEERLETADRDQLDALKRHVEGLRGGPSDLLIESIRLAVAELGRAQGST